MSSSYTGPVKLVVLDLAGTLVDYGSRAPAGAFVALFERHGVTATQAQAREPMGLHKRDHIRAMTRFPEIAAQWRQRKGRAPSEGDVEALFEEFIPIQLESLPRFGELIPGAADAVAALREQGTRVAVTTGYDEAMMDLVLKSAAEQGLEPDVSVCAAQVPTGRPAPWLIYRCMEQTGVFPREAVVKIGDTIADVEAGLNAGVWSVGVVKTGNMLGLSREEIEALPGSELECRIERGVAKMKAAGAHFVLEEVGESPALIREINQRLARGEAP